MPPKGTRWHKITRNRKPNSISANLPALQAKLQALGAHLKQARVFESNLRFDLPDASLAGKRQVLRLRQDERARMTFKGPMEAGAEVSSRPEIEVRSEQF